MMAIEKDVKGNRNTRTAYVNVYEL